MSKSAFNCKDCLLRQPMLLIDGFYYCGRCGIPFNLIGGYLVQYEKDESEMVHHFFVDVNQYSAVVNPLIKRVSDDIGAFQDTILTDVENKLSSALAGCTSGVSAVVTENADMITEILVDIVDEVVESALKPNS